MKDWIVTDRDRELYGSDFPVSHQRGRCLALGDSFLVSGGTTRNGMSPTASWNWPLSVTNLCAH